MRPSVVITGFGACTTQDPNADELWDRIAGTPGSRVSAPRPAERGLPDQLAHAETLAWEASLEALTQAGLWNEGKLVGADAERVGCTVSASKPLFKGTAILPPDLVNSEVSQRLGLHGEKRNVIAACATGAYAVALGASWIDQGLCDVVLAGSVEPSIHPLIEAGFKQMGVVSEEAVMRPFDRRRSGFVLGAGAGAVVLESSAHALGRGAVPLAALSGWGWGADGHSPVAFNSNGERIAEVIRRTLHRAGLSPENILHVNAHGTATPVNDRIETQALLKAFGRSAERLMVSATKSSTGHLLGAAGSVELVLLLQALKHQFVPPTAHLEEPDPLCALDYTSGQGHAASFMHAMSLSFGFGGPIGALIVSGLS